VDRGLGAHSGASSRYAFRRGLRRRRASEEKGQALVEFAIALPALLAVILAIVDFGITLNHWETLTDATRAAGRVAATCRFSPGTYAAKVTTAYNNAATDLPGHGPPTIGACSSTPGNSITVTGSYPYHVRVFGVAVYSGNLTATSVERVE
jgi:TadE-like protein